MESEALCANHYPMKIPASLRRVARHLREAIGNASFGMPFPGGQVTIELKPAESERPPARIKEPLPVPPGRYSPNA